MNCAFEEHYEWMQQELCRMMHETELIHPGTTILGAMMDDYTIKKGTPVAVCKGRVTEVMVIPITFELVRHKMKSDMSFCRIKDRNMIDPGAIAIHRLKSFIPESRRITLGKLYAVDRVGKMGQMSFWELCCSEFDIFATGHKMYPYLIVPSALVDSIAD